MDTHQDAADVGPVALKAVRQMRRQILSGRLKAGMLLPSVRQLSASTGIGLVTAHRALQRAEGEGWVERDPEGRRLRVRKQAARLARGFFEGEPPSVVYWVVPGERRATGAFRLPELSEGLQEGLPFSSSRYLFLNPTEKLGAVRHLLREHAKSAEVGFILLSLPLAQKDLFARLGVACVVIGEAEGELRCPSVAVDYRKLGLLAGKLLCRRGAAMGIFGPELVGGEKHLIEGFSDAARVLDQPPPDPQQFHVHVPPEGGGVLNAIEAMLSRAPRPAGVVATRTEFALATTRMAARLGIGVPEELQVIAIPHHPLLQYANPQITSIGLGSDHELGRICAELLGDSFVGRPRIPARIEMQPTLIEGESTLPAG